MKARKAAMSSMRDDVVVAAMRDGLSTMTDLEARIAGVACLRRSSRPLVVGSKLV